MEKSELGRIHVFLKRHLHWVRAEELCNGAGFALILHSWWDSFLLWVWETPIKHTSLLCTSGSWCDSKPHTAWAPQAKLHKALTAPPLPPEHSGCRLQENKMFNHGEGDAWAVTVSPFWVTNTWKAPWIHPPLGGPLWSLSWGGRWWVLPESLMLTKTATEKGADHRRFQWKHFICSCGFGVVSTDMGKDFKGARLRPEGSAWGCYSTEPKGSAVLGVLPGHQREKPPSLCCCRNGGSSIQIRGWAAPRGWDEEHAQGTMSLESYCGLGIWSWSMCCGVTGQGDPHPFSSLQLWPVSFTVSVETCLWNCRCRLSLCLLWRNYHCKQDYLQAKEPLMFNYRYKPLWATEYFFFFFFGNTSVLLPLETVAFNLTY